MRLAVLSDIHGNLPALQAVLADLDDFKPDRILVAGDYLRGPFPNEVIDCLRDRDASLIIGNDDQHTLRYIVGQAPEGSHTLKQWGVIRWTVEQLTAENVTLLQSLPEQRVFAVPGTEAIRVVHGSPASPNEGIFVRNGDPTLGRSLAAIDEPVLVCGHTHCPWAAAWQGKLALNPGSVAGTQGGALAQYARLTWEGSRWQVELRQVPYDIAALRMAFEQRGLLEAAGAYALGFLRSMETGVDWMMAFLQHARRLAEDRVGPESLVIPDEIWDAAEQSFDWTGS